MNTLTKNIILFVLTMLGYVLFLYLIFLALVFWFVGHWLLVVIAILGMMLDFVCLSWLASLGDV